MLKYIFQTALQRVFLLASKFCAALFAEKYNLPSLVLFLMLRLESGALSPACAGQSCWNGMERFLPFVSFCPSSVCNAQLPKVFRLFHFSGFSWVNECLGTVLASSISCHNARTTCSATTLHQVQFLVFISKTVWQILFQCIAGGFQLVWGPVAHGL